MRREKIKPKIKSHKKQRGRQKQNNKDRIRKITKQSQQTSIPSNNEFKKQFKSKHLHIFRSFPLKK
jgi:hypothetical protein